MPVALIVLAAGRGTRMKSDMPKVLHQIGNLPLYAHALNSGAALSPDRQILIVGHEAEMVRADVEARGIAAEIVVQDEQNGTGHAALMAKDALSGFTGDAIVLFGDTPFVRPETLERVVEARKSNDVVVLGFRPDDAARYGRLVTDGDKLLDIVEYKDASTDQRAIGFCNSGILAADASLLFDLLGKLTPENEAGELYLTEVVRLANVAGHTCTAIECEVAETLGVNSRADLAAAEAVFQQKMRADAMELGVTLIAPETVFFSADTHIGRDVLVEPNVVFGPDVTVESGARIRAFSHLEGAHVGARATVGPYARLRPGAELANDTHIGNFVEIKNAVIGDGAKVNHLSYVGDASVGEKTNIGAGTITCNYDGVSKHRTEIGARVFVGSNSMFVAPVKVGNDAMTATGTIVTKDVPDEALAIGRAAQTNKPGLAVKLFEKLKAAKKKQQERS